MKTCPWCEQKFVPRTSRQTFCGMVCRRQHDHVEEHYRDIQRLMRNNGYGQLRVFSDIDPLYIPRRDEWPEINQPRAECEYIRVRLEVHTPEVHPMKDPYYYDRDTWELGLPDSVEEKFRLGQVRAADH